jgi:hypothetical protein
MAGRSGSPTDARHEADSHALTQVHGAPRI